MSQNTKKRFTSLNARDGGFYKLILIFDSNFVLIEIYSGLKMQVVIDFQSLTKLQPRLQPLWVVINYNFLSFLY